MKIYGYSILVGAAAVSVASGSNIVDTLSGDTDYGTLVIAVTQAGLVETLSGDGPFTVMAPVNAAFVPLGPSTTNTTILAHLLAANDYSKGLLVDVLTTHVLSGNIASTAIPFNDPQPTVNTAEKLVFTNDAGIQVATEAASNSKADVTNPDILASNGVIHGISAVLVPDIPSKTIAQTAQDTAALSSLVAALSRAGYVDLFNQATGNAWTVFAPTNDAFAAAFQALGFNALTDIPVDTLQTILQAHVLTTGAGVSGACDSTCVGALGTSFETLGGETIQSSQISLVTNLTDIPNLNGIVHVVDQVIVPPSLQGDDDGSAGVKAASVALATVAIVAQFLM